MSPMSTCPTESPQLDYLLISGGLPARDTGTSKGVRLPPAAAEHGGAAAPCRTVTGADSAPGVGCSTEFSRPGDMFQAVSELLNSGRVRAVEGRQVARAGIAPGAAVPAKRSNRVRTPLEQVLETELNSAGLVRPVDRSGCSAQHAADGLAEARRVREVE